MTATYLPPLRCSIGAAYVRAHLFIGAAILAGFGAAVAGAAILVAARPDPRDEGRRL